MIVVRNVFKIKFGKAREATQCWKEGIALTRKLGLANGRVLTDVVGPSYTLVVESVHENIAEWETTVTTAMAKDEWQKWYQKFVPLAESGYREIFKIVD